MNKNEIAFLDTTVYRSPTQRIYTRIYHKPTDQKQYLHYHSAHHRNQKESVPYGLLIRCRRICRENHYLEEATKIFNQLKYRKYPTDLLNQAIHLSKEHGEINPTETIIQKKSQDKHQTHHQLQSKEPQIASNTEQNLKDCY